jgi:hypothetical protein
MADVHNGAYYAYLSEFGPESFTSPETLLDRVLLRSNDVPKAFLVLERDRFCHHASIRVIHRPTRYAASLADTTLCRWDDRVFGFVGDLLHGNFTNVIEWPFDAFSPKDYTWVPCLHDMEEAWTACARFMLGPFDANSAKYERIRARTIVPIPHRYVRLCLSRDSFTPREFWRDVVGKIAQDDLLTNCAVLVDWARVACTYGPKDMAPDVIHNLATISLPLGIELRVMLLDDVLSARRWSWVLEDLPALGRMSTTLEQMLLDQNTTLLKLLADRQVDDAAEVRAASRVQRELENAPGVAEATADLVHRQINDAAKARAALLQRQLDDAAAEAAAEATEAAAEAFWADLAQKAADRAEKEFSSIIYPEAAVEVEILSEAPTSVELPAICKIIVTQKAADWAEKEFASVIYPQAAVEVQMLSEAPTLAALPPIYKIIVTLRKSSSNKKRHR